MKKMESKSLFLVFLLIANLSAAIDDITLTSIESKIQEAANGINGEQHFMKVSVSPDSQKLALSSRYMQYEPKTTMPPMRIFDIGSDFKLTNERSITPSLTTGNQRLVSSDKILAHEITGTTGKFQFYTISPSVVTETGSPEATSNSNYCRIIVKPSKNIILARVNMNDKFFSLTSLNPLYPAAGTEKRFRDMNTAWSYYDYGIAFNPDDSSTELIVTGSNSALLIVDFSNLLLSTPEALNAGSFKYGASHQGGGTAYVEDFSTFFDIEYNHKKTNEFYISILSAVNNKLGVYLKMDTGYSFTGLGYIDKTLHGLVRGAREESKNIIGTDYFFSVFLNDVYILDKANSLALIDAGNIPLDGKMDYKIVTNQVVPTGLTEAYITSMEIINSDQGVWVFSGATGSTGGNKGFYHIVKLNSPFVAYTPTPTPTVEKCHDDCLTCTVKDNDSAKCITCSNTSVKILGPSGCNCAANCISCSENQNSQKCKACVKGYYLKDDNNDGEGECVEGETALTTCTAGKTSAESSLATCNTDKTSAEASLATCNTGKTVAENNLNSCNTGKTTAESSLATCNTDKATLQTSLDTCNSGSGQTNSDCESEKTVLQGNFDKCQKEKDEAGNDLKSCNTQKSTVEGDLIQCKNEKKESECSGFKLEVYLGVAFVIGNFIFWG